jgi:hypothetical protein
VSGSELVSRRASSDDAFGLGKIGPTPERRSSPIGQKNIAVIDDQVKVLTCGPGDLDAKVREREHVRLLAQGAVFCVPFVK